MEVPIIHPFSDEDLLSSRLAISKLLNLDSRSSLVKENENNAEFEIDSNLEWNSPIQRINAKNVILISNELNDVVRLLASFISRNKIKNYSYITLRMSGLSILRAAQNLLRLDQGNYNIWIILADNDPEITEVLREISKESSIRCILMKSEKDLKFLGFFANNFEIKKFVDFLQNMISNEINHFQIENKALNKTNYPNLHFAIGSNSIVRSLRSTSNGKVQICADFSEEDLLAAMKYTHQGSWGKLSLRWASLQKSEDFMAWVQSYAPSKRLPENVHTLLALFAHLLCPEKSKAASVEKVSLQIVTEKSAEISSILHPQPVLFLTYDPEVN